MGDSHFYSLKILTKTPKRSLKEPIILNDSYIAKSSPINPHNPKSPIKIPPTCRGPKIVAG
jgi:hypothetical protein